MVHVYSLQLEGMLIAQRQQRVQQDDRIEPPRKCQHQPRVLGNVAGKNVRHPIDDSLIWQEFP